VASLNSCTGGLKLTLVCVDTGIYLNALLTYLSVFLECRQALSGALGFAKLPARHCAGAQRRTAQRFPFQQRGDRETRRLLCSLPNEPTCRASETGSQVARAGQLWRMGTKLVNRYFWYLSNTLSFLQPY